MVETCFGKQRILLYWSTDTVNCQLHRATSCTVLRSTRYSSKYVIRHTVFMWFKYWYKYLVPGNRLQVTGCIICIQVQVRVLVLEHETRFTYEKFQVQCTCTSGTKKQLRTVGHRMRTVLSPLQSSPFRSCCWHADVGCSGVLTSRPILPVQLSLHHHSGNHSPLPASSLFQ